MPFKAREVLAKLERAGFEVKRPSGSHVAMHTRDVPEGTLRTILKQAELTMEVFKRL